MGKPVMHDENTTKDLIYHDYEKDLKHDKNNNKLNHNNIFSGK